MTKASICILPQVKTTGGPSSFQSKLKAGLSARGIDTHHEISRNDTRALLITGATRNFGSLIEARHRRIRIVQRLDGMNWLHKKSKTGLRHYFRSERMNLQLAIIRRCFADRIVYQSEFTQDWWSRVFGKINKPSTTIYNGVDLNEFQPSSRFSPPGELVRILVVEGSFRGGHERDLLNALGFAEGLAKYIGKKVELVIAGNIPEDLRNHLTSGDSVKINWVGVVPHEQIPDLDRSAHLFFPAEINAACPNSVVEALACGLPVVGYATGSISELVGDEGGAVAPYGSDYWNLESPTVEGLVHAAADVLDNLPKFHKSARNRAESFFGLDHMVEAYIEILLGD